MSRKDTIIVAVLINVGLLIVLFASALKSGNEGEELATLPKVVTTPVKDEVDLVLSQYAQTTAVVPEVSIQPLAPAVVEALPGAPSSSFVEDLTLAAKEPALPSPPVVQTQEAPVVKYTEYKVKKGDVLEKIARHHHCSVTDLKKLNNLSSTYLKIGQVLKIPGSSKAASVVKTAETQEQGAPQYYTVKAGDNPWTIAVKNHMKVEELLKLNHLNEEKARRLKAGDQIRIR